MQLGVFCMCECAASICPSYCSSNMQGVSFVASVRTEVLSHRNLHLLGHPVRAAVLRNKVEEQYLWNWFGDLENF
jgi:hypothetical protein